MDILKNWQKIPTKVVKFPLKWLNLSHCLDVAKRFATSKMVLLPKIFKIKSKYKDKISFLIRTANWLSCSTCTVHSIVGEAIFRSVSIQWKIFGKFRLTFSIICFNLSWLSNSFLPTFCLESCCFYMFEAYMSMVCFKSIFVFI